MPYEQDREDREYRQRHQGHNSYDAGEHFDRDQRRPRNQHDDRRREDDRPRRDTSHYGDVRGRDDRRDDRRHLDYRDPNFRGTNQLPDEVQRPGAFPRGMGPNNNRYEGDYRGGRGYYNEERNDWRQNREFDRPDNRGRFHDPYDGDNRPPVDRPSGYGAPGERVRPLNRGDQYGDDSRDPRGYYDDNRNRPNDNYPGRDRARNDRDGRYHYDEDDRNDRRR